MAFWEFLIQKEGDRSWLPLESPDVEILEGRYRVVARSSRVNVPVEIRITHDAIAEEPPKRRVQKRTSGTNPDGLIVVIPFTRLHPGIWELRCTGDLMSDMLGEGWHHTVKLQVISHESELTEEWDPDWQEEAESSPNTDVGHISTTGQTVPVVAAESSVESAVRESSLETAAMQSDTPSQPLAMAIAALPTADMASITTSIEQIEGITDISEAATSSLLEVARQASQQVLDDVFQDLEVPDRAAPQTASAGSDETMASGDRTVAPLPLQIMLQRETYTAQRGKPVELAGQIQLLEEALDVVVEPFEAELWLCLRNPQTAQALLELRRSLSIQTLPHAFELSFALPETDQTRLFLGELCLLAKQTPDKALQIWVSQSFTVTADLHELLEAIANDSTEAENLHPPLEFVKPTDTSLNLAFLNLLDAPKPILNFQTSGKQLLPPQLYQPDPSQPRTKGIDLPFSNPAASAALSDLGKALIKSVTSPITTSDDTEPPPSESQAGTDAPAGSDEDAIATESKTLTAARTSDPQPIEPPGNSIPSNPITIPINTAAKESLADAPLELETLTKPQIFNAPSFPGKLTRSTTWKPAENEAFRALNLQQRFWSRLSSMAGDAELSDWLQRVDPVESGILRDAPLDCDRHLSTYEFVVDDELPSPPAKVSDEADAEPLNQFSEADDFPVLSEDESVPSPQLELPERELTSGTSIRVMVRLPNLEPRIYVKLWMRDRQTRAILDGPKWLVNFIPNAAGELEAWTQLVIPFGCLEIQFEAIAIEMSTQRESDKTTRDRIVIPPDLPLPSVELRDELDV
jgi:hypothetical protein